MPSFSRAFRITWMGVGYRGAPREIAPGVLLAPTNLHGGDLVGAYRARLDWETLAPDAVFALNDPWYLEHYSRHLAGVLGRVPMIGYMPLDGDVDDAGIFAELKGFSALYTYTAHAAGQLRAALQSCGIETPVAVAGHGVDLHAFSAPASVVESAFDARPRMALAQQLFRLDAPAWVVLNASRPDPRKRIDLTIDGFARFARGKPAGVKLCLHQAIGHPQFVEPLRQQAAAAGIEDRMLWWPQTEGPLTDEGLCALYNACAAGINTSLGEGFGLVSFEHAATGAPQIVPDHPALRELWGDAALLLGPPKRVRVEHSPLVMGEVSADQVAGALSRLYVDPVEYRHYARAAHARTLQDDLRWSGVAERLSAGLVALLRNLRHH